MKLILFPNLLDDDEDIDHLPKIVFSKIKTLDGLIAENKKRARAYLKHFFSSEKIRDFWIEELNEHSNKEDMEDLLKRVQGKTFGLISDAGMPCIADPGSFFISLCYKNNIQVEAIMGSSSIFLALLLSGFSGQRFCFHGYLPRKEVFLKKKLKDIEKDVFEKKMTQIFIEAPYRSNKIFQIMLKVLKNHTNICVCTDLMGKEEKIILGKVGRLREKGIDLYKRKCVFLIG